MFLQVTMSDYDRREKKLEKLDNTVDENAKSNPGIIPSSQRSATSVDWARNQSSPATLDQRKREHQSMRGLSDDKSKATYPHQHDTLLS